MCTTCVSTIGEASSMTAVYAAAASAVITAGWQKVGPMLGRGPTDSQPATAAESDR